jgi:aquaporin Z
MNKFYAEALGTFALVFIGCGAAVVNDVSGGAVSHVGVSLAFGLVVMAMIYSVGNISGAHLNPAVTLGFWAAGRLSRSDIRHYLAAQLFGAVTASLALKLLFPEHPTLGATIPAGSFVQSFVLEYILTFLLMFVILNVSTGHMEKGIMAGVAVGGTIAFMALMGGPISGASMNPARSLGPGIVSGSWSGLLIYIIAPVLGAVSAKSTCRMIQGKECCHVLEEENGDKPKSPCCG